MIEKKNLLTFPRTATRLRWNQEEKKYYTQDSSGITDIAVNIQISLAKVP